MVFILASAYEKKTLQPPKELINIFSRSALIPEPKALGLVNDGCKFRQKGGRKEALKLIKSFSKIEASTIIGKCLHQLQLLTIVQDFQHI